MYRKRNQLMELAVCLADALAVLFSLTVAGMIRYREWSVLAYKENLRELYSVVLVLHVASFYFLKVYDGFFKRGRYRELLLSVKYNLILIAGATLLGFGLKNDVFVSRLVMGYFFLLNVFVVWVLHLSIRNRERVFRWSNRRVTNLLIVTTADRLDEIRKNFQRSKETTWNIVGAVLLGGRKGINIPDDFAVVPDTEEAYLEYATQNVVDEVFIQVDYIQKREKFLKNMILEFEKMGLVVNLNLDLFNLGVTGEKRIYKLEQYHVVAFSSRLFDYRTVLVKRLIDIVGSVIGLLLTGAVGLILAPFLLMESPGPLIFKQKRVGVNGRIFDFYKFRSMYADAEERKKRTDAAE